MEDVNNVPSKKYVADPENLWMLTAEERKKTPTDRINGYF